MPVHYRLAPELNLLYAAGFGHCTGGQFLESELAARGHPLRRADMLILLDLQGIAELDFDLAELKSLVQMNRQRAAANLPLERTAWLIRHRMDAVLMETYEALAERSVQLSMALFYTMEEALAWLDLPGRDEEVQAIRRALREEYRRAAYGSAL